MKIGYFKSKLYFIMKNKNELKMHLDTVAHIHIYMKISQPLY